MPTRKKGRRRKPNTNTYQKQKYADRRLFITERNRRAKQARHVKNHPNDKTLATKPKD